MLAFVLWFENLVIFEKQVNGLKRSCLYWVKDNRESDLLVIVFLSQSTLEVKSIKNLAYSKEYSSFVSLFLCLCLTHGQILELKSYAFSFFVWL